MNSKAYSVRKLQEVSEVPGIYAWYLLYNQKIDLQAYHSVYKQRQLFSFLKGNLQDNYQGTLSAQPYLFDKPVQDLNLLAGAIDVFSPPIYIGVSNNLKRRLLTHITMLNHILYADHVEDIVDIIESDIDSDKESKHFAQRISSVIKGINGIGLNSFRVKVIELAPGYSSTMLVEVENFLNRTFIPYYGRR
ncbi:hypothetical protein [Scytonema sp. NUACC26]|uniref:hypothetical protein n=1 Tax=Scytonema sp. NUACC26 TaxID=3140176 RepID=UPI0034DC8958